MSDDRPKIPADLVRQVMLETGYACAVCRARPPLDIDHIVDWVKVREHKFDNLIALCPTCHRLKKNTSDPRHINRASLKSLKSNLMMLNGRYSDIERRFIEVAREFLVSNPDKTMAMLIHGTMYLSVKYIIDDGLVTAEMLGGGIGANVGGVMVTNDQIKIVLTEEGKKFVRQLQIN